MGHQPPFLTWQHIYLVSLALQMFSYLLAQDLRLSMLSFISFVYLADKTLEFNVSLLNTCNLKVCVRPSFTIKFKTIMNTVSIYNETISTRKRLFEVENPDIIRCDIVDRHTELFSMILGFFTFKRMSRLPCFILFICNNFVIYDSFECNSTCLESLCMHLTSSIIHRVCPLCRGNICISNSPPTRKFSG